MSKAYDRVEWGFLEQIMLHIGFDSSWVNLIMRCVSSVSYSFNLNGERVGLVQPNQGLGQGDPLSPYLFLFCAEDLSNMLLEAEKRKCISGFKIARGGPTLSHLFFCR